MIDIKKMNLKLAPRVVSCAAELGAKEKYEMVNTIRPESGRHPHLSKARSARSTARRILHSMCGAGHDPAAERNPVVSAPPPGFGNPFVGAEEVSWHGWALPEGGGGHIVPIKDDRS